MTKRLGKGLADLIDLPLPLPTAPEIPSEHPYLKIRTDQIQISRFQPRVRIDDKTIEELKASIQRQGVIEPIIVRPKSQGGYELVAGERRLKATKALDIPEIPAIVKELSDKDAFLNALMENVQRENLHALEEAQGYARLMSEFGYTQEEVAQAVGKDRTSIANLLRLLHLPEEIHQGLWEGTITVGHAKVLAGIEPRTKQLEFFRAICSRGMSVRQLEVLVGRSGTRPRRLAQIHESGDAHLRRIEDELRRALGTKVSLIPRKGSGGGRILVEYFSSEDLTRILTTLKISL